MTPTPKELYNEICSAPAVATGIKRSLPDNEVIVYQGDGDMVSEGIAELISSLEGCYYSERVSVDSPKNVIVTKKAIKKVFDIR